jgi:hypothetical protein
MTLSSPTVAHTCRKRRLKWVPSASQTRRPNPPGWGLGVELTASPRKNSVVRKSK